MPGLRSQGTVCASPREGLSSSFARRALVAYLAVLFAAAMVMRTWALGEIPGLNGDEAWYGVQALRWWHGQPVAWSTPTGNPVNLLFLGPLIGLHGVFGASALLLRCVSLAAGVLALALNYCACRRLYDAVTARWLLFFLAILPINIAYCRFAWDTSETLLVSSATLYAAIAVARHSREWSRWAVLVASALLSCYVHPSNALGFPVLAGLLWPLPSNSGGRREGWRLAAVWLVGLTMIALVVLVLSSKKSLPGTMAAQVRLVTDTGGFMIRLGAFVSGLSVYEYISNPPDGVTSSVGGAVGWLAIVCAIGALLLRIREHRDRESVRLAMGLLVAVAALWALTGGRGVPPGFERYMMWLVAPAALAAALGWAWVTSASRIRATIAALSAMVLASALLLGFWSQYLAPFRSSGGNGHPTFRIGERDPKALAFGLVVNSKAAGTPAVIVSSGWWTRWALEYHALGSADHLQVASLDEASEWPNDRLRAAWFMELAGSDDALAVEALMRNRGLKWNTIQLRDRAGRPVLVVLRAS